MLLISYANFFSKSTFFNKNSLRNTNRLSNVLDPELDPGSKLFVKFMSRQQKSPLTGKELIDQLLLNLFLRKRVMKHYPVDFYQVC